MLAMFPWDFCSLSCNSASRFPNSSLDKTVLG